ncbi:hypothetical protein ACLOJK_033117 [Asimina triloba]
MARFPAKMRGVSRHLQPEGKIEPFPAIYSPTRRSPSQREREIEGEMDETPPPLVAGRRRSRGSEAATRADALERLRALRSGGRRSESSYKIKMEDPVYDTVAEDDYAALVAKRREAARDFIVDDDGLGYGDEGEEEDWSKAGLPPSSDESEGEAEKLKKKKAAVKKEQPPKKQSSSLSAAAALMGKQRLSEMFTSSIFRKSREDKGKGLSAAESIVDDVIAEFAPDEADRERRRRAPPAKANVIGFGHPSGVPIKKEFQTTSTNPTAEPEQHVVLSNHPIVQENGNLGCDTNPTKEVKENVVLNSEAELESERVSPPNDSSPNVNSEMETATNSKEAKAEAVMSEGVFSLNAKLKVDSNPALSAAAGWKEVCGLENENSGVDGGAPVSSDEKAEFALDSDGSLPFYMIDAYEETYGANLGTLYMFGKVKAGSAYLSCCLVVRNMQRCVYAIPNDSVFPKDKTMELENDATDSQISPTDRKKLQEMASGLKNEIGTKLMDLNVSSFSMAPVKRSYAFERTDISHGQHYVLKVNYPFKVLSIKMVSWCKFEVTIDCPKDVKILPSARTVPEIPPVIVASINLKTMVSEKHNGNEIVSASVICCQKAKSGGDLEYSAISVLCASWKEAYFPWVSQKRLLREILKLPPISLELTAGNERALINRFMIELHKLDCDVLVGHNISGFDLDVLLHRAQACKVPSSMWSRIGRLKRSAMPKLSRGSTTFGSGASPGIMSCIAGRLLCDTFLCARDLLKEVSYSLTQLVKTQLNKDRREIAPHEIPAMFQTSGSLLDLVDCGETDAWLSLELMFHLSVLPLTRQLTNISGNLWGKTLQGARAQRVEYLLLHEFHAKKYIVPDKIPAHGKESRSAKRKGPSNLESGDVRDENANEMPLEDDMDQLKGRKGPSYAGGLVLEPKRGLYDKFVLLLDFNSLYPSIIQEYNICFTTVERTLDGSIPSLPSSKVQGVLPKLLKNLVERRRNVKNWLKNASGIRLQQLDIQQQALKLTANRFYAKPLAELITLQGREILQSTVDLVQNNLNLEVIYGDTDSIMIYSGLDDIAKAKAIAGKVIQEVNKKYRCLEIDLDGLYKRMLLLKKKKYAAVKLQFRDGMPYEVIERKGLDMVRRDWSLLSKEIGDFCLSQILSGGSCEDVVESIHSSLIKVQEEMRNGEIVLDKYVITKSLTKPPEDYPDAKNQPHVQVALRLKQSGYSTGCSAGDTVPYVICCQQGVESGSTAGIAQRARHPDELKKDNGNWMIDIDYYLSQQIHPVVSRLCASIQGTSPARLADCLGLDSSKFQHKTIEASSKDPTSMLLGMADDDERYRGCEPLWLSCPSCSGTIECPAVSSFLVNSSENQNSDSPAEKESTNHFWRRLCCPRCPDEGDGNRISPLMMANQVKRQAEKFISTYYTALMTCDDEICKYTTRSLNLRVIGDSERGTVCPNYPRCNGHLIRQYTEVDLYKQLSYFCYLLDTERFIEKLEHNARLAVEKELARIRPVVDLAASAIKEIRDRCAYGWVQLQDLSVTV